MPRHLGTLLAFLSVTTSIGRQKQITMLIDIQMTRAIRAVARVDFADFPQIGDEKMRRILIALAVTAAVAVSFSASSAMAGGPYNRGGYGHGHGHGHYGAPGHYDYHNGHIDYHVGGHRYPVYGAPRVYTRYYSPGPFYGRSYYAPSYYGGSYYGGGGGFYLNGRNFSVGVGF